MGGVIPDTTVSGLFPRSLCDYLLGQGQFVCLQWRCGRGGVSCAEEEVNAKPRVGLGHGLIRHLQGLGFYGDDTQAVGTGLGWRRAVGAGEPGAAGRRFGGVSTEAPW